MFYIFNSVGNNLGFCDVEPDLDDLKVRNEYVKEVTPEQHVEFLKGRDSGCMVLPTLELTPPKPSIYCYWDWDLGEWVDPRTEEEILNDIRLSMPVLSKTQVELCLFDLDEYTSFEVELSKNARLRIQYNSTNDFHRVSALTDSIQELMQKTDEEMDEFWKLASEIEI